MHEVIPGARVEGKVLLDDEDIYGPGVDPVDVRRTIGMVFQRPNPFPTMSIYDNVVAGLRAQRRAARRPTLDDVVERSLRGAGPLGRGQGPAAAGPAPGCPAASSSGCASPGRSRCEPQVLLMDEPCSALDPISTLAIEDLIGELKEQLHDRHRHAQHAAGRPGQRHAPAFFNIAGAGQPGKLIEMDATQKIFTQPGREADRGLHHRPLRLKPDRCIRLGRVRDRCVCSDGGSS